MLFYTLGAWVIGICIYIQSYFYRRIEISLSDCLFRVWVNRIQSTSMASLLWSVLQAPSCSLTVSLLAPPRTIRSPF